MVDDDMALPSISYQGRCFEVITSHTKSLPSVGRLLVF